MSEQKMSFERSFGEETKKTARATGIALEISRFREVFMKSVPLKLVLLMALFIIFTACTPAKDHTTRVGRGSNTRNNGTNYQSTGSGQPLSGISQFFTNYTNSNGTPFALPSPCNITQVGVAAQSGNYIQLDFVLSCMAQNTDGSTFNDIRISIGSGQPGFSSATNGTLADGRIYVTYTDDMGDISLVGNIQGQQFVGSIWYDNAWAIMTDGTQQSPGASGWLASFTMPACLQSGGLFQCN